MTPLPASASSHREAPAIARGPTGLDDALTGVTTSYERGCVDGPGTTVSVLANGQGRVFAGPRDDPFYADLGALSDLAQLRPLLSLQGGKALGGTGAQVCASCVARDSLRYTNVHTLALEPPGAVANGGAAVAPGSSAAQTLGIWASTSRRKVSILDKKGGRSLLGPWQQVSRVGFPFINTLVIGLQDKDRFNASTPRDDAALFGGYFLNPILARDAEVLGLYASTLSACRTPTGEAPLSSRPDVFSAMHLSSPGPLTGANALKSLGDVLRVDLGTPLQDFPNGRRLDTSGTGTTETVDVTDTVLKLLMCTLSPPGSSPLLAPNAQAPNTPYGGIPDGVNGNEAAFKSTFPYLAPPWPAFSASPNAAPAD